MFMGGVFYSISLFSISFCWLVAFEDDCTLSPTNHFKGLDIFLYQTCIG